MNLSLGFVDDKSLNPKYVSTSYTSDKLYTFHNLDIVLIKMSNTHFIWTVFTKPNYLNRVGVLAISCYDVSDEVFWYSLALNNVYKRHVHTFVSMFEYVINIIYKPESLSSCVE